MSVVSAPTACGAREFKDTLAAVATAVSVATMLTPEGPRAVTIGSLCSVSLDPPLVLFCLARSSGSHDDFVAAPRFAVSVLAANQETVARRCSGPPAGRASVPMTTLDGIPVVAGALAHLVCAAYGRADGGDHTIVIGEVLRANACPGAPLVYHQREYHRLGLPVGQEYSDDDLFR